MEAAPVISLRNRGRNWLDGRFGMYLAGLAVLLILMLLWFIWSAMCWVSSSDVTYTVKDKWIKNDVYYVGVVYADSSEEVFRDTDSWFHWKSNSADVYNTAEKGVKYNARVAGMRWSWFSWFRNIVTTPTRAPES